MKRPSKSLFNAYVKLWHAVENGTIDRDFFKLREQFRKEVEKIKNKPEKEIKK